MAEMDEATVASCAVVWQGVLAKQAAVWDTGRDRSIIREIIMDIPPISHPRWTSILKGTTTGDIKFLGLRLMLGRLKGKVANQPAALPDALKEFHAFFVEHGKLPTLQTDLQTLFR